MTSKERLLAAITGSKIPDRVPISTYELVGFDPDSFCNHEPSYHALMERIRQSTDCMCMWDPPSDDFILCTSTRPELHREESPTHNGREVHTTLRIGSRTLTSTQRFVNGIETVWQTEYYCKTTQDVDTLLQLPYTPVTIDPEAGPKMEKHLGENGIIMGNLADPAYLAMSLMAFGEGAVWAMEEEEHFASVVEKLHRRCMESLERRLSSDGAVLYRICGPEYMTPPYLPPRFFERYMEPYIREMIDLIHSRGKLARLHCHGRIARVFDSILRTGCDAVDPCEAPPDGDIPLAELSRRAEGRVCLMGNLQLRLLEGGTEEQVRDAVRGCMTAAKSSGRYILMPTAAPINIPLAPKTEANYFAFIDEGLKTGGY